MDIATGAISSLLPKLAELRMEEYKLPKGVRRDIEYIRDEMMRFQAALRKLAEVPLYQKDPQVRIWANVFKGLSYAIHDEVDSFLMDSELSKPANLNFKGRMKKVANRFNKGKTQSGISDAIKDIKVQVIRLAERYDRYKIGDFVAYPASRAVDPRLSDLYPRHTDILGIEESREDLIRKIISQDDYSSNRQLKILSIFGSIGIGKTTLAKVVYDHLNTEFSCSGFLSVGRQPDPKKILRDLILEIDVQRYTEVGTLDEGELVDALRMLLEKKRYLIVVDDIWDIHAWETIRQAVVDHDSGSSVIITTRNFEVAQKAGEVYKMKPLSQAKSEELLYTRLFRGEEKIPDEFVEVTQSIIKKCDCIPLAILTMASLLLNKPSIDWSLVYNSIGFGHGDYEVVQNTRKISSFSYYDIPSYLRTCLLHLSIFPEGYMIRKDTLIWKWIAEGFVREEWGVGLFQIGERYFNELINKSLVQPVEIPHSGIIIGCHVNIIVLDMICAFSKEENFVRGLDSHKEGTHHLYLVPILAIQNSVVQENKMLASPTVWSFNATKCEFQMMPSLTSFRFLRVLALEDCASIGGIYHLEHIRKLVQLRYLGLFNTPICELPEGIGNLKFLQTLDLRQTKIDDLPHGIVQLTQLKCLRVGTISLTVPDGMGNLASLEELQLSDVSSSPNIVKELGKLIKLRDLKVCIRLSNERVERDLVYSLGDLQKLEILHLDGGLWIEESCWESYIPSIHLRHVFLGMKFIRLPAWINPILLPNLSHLSVDVSVLEEEDLLILGSFPELLYLSLAGEYVCLPDIMGGGAFPSLKYCYTSGMVRFLNGAAPGLEYVSFNVRLWGPKDGSFDFDFHSLLGHPLLQEVGVEIFYTEAHVMEVSELEAALSSVVKRHLNRPKLTAIGKWISSVSEQFGSHNDVDGNEYYDDNEEDTHNDVDGNEYYDDNEEDTDHKYYNDEE